MFTIGNRFNIWMFYVCGFLICLLLPNLYSMAVFGFLIFCLVLIFARWAFQGFPQRLLDANKNTGQAWNHRNYPPDSLRHRFDRNPKSSYIQDGLKLKYNMLAVALSLLVGVGAVKLIF